MSTPNQFLYAVAWHQQGSAPSQTAACDAPLPWLTSVQQLLNKSNQQCITTSHGRHWTHPLHAQYPLQM